MTTNFGPWATAASAGSKAHLSTFWKRRLRMLPATHASRGPLGRRAILFLAIGATSVWVLPTLRSAVEQGNVQAADGSVATIAAVKSNEIRTTVPTNPFECAHSRSFHYDKTGRRLICVTQRGELLVWNDNGESPAVTLLEKKPGGRVFDRAPMSAVVVARGTDVVLFYLDGRVQVWSVDTRRRVKDLESDQSTIR